MRTFTAKGWRVLGGVAALTLVGAAFLFGCTNESRGEAMQRKAEEARELEVRKANVLTCLGFYDNAKGFQALVDNAASRRFTDVRVKLDLFAGQAADERLRKSVIVDVGTVAATGSQSAKIVAAGLVGAGEFKHVNCGIESFREG